MSFESARITVGRAASSDLHFDPFEDLAVAPHHAEILLAEDGIYYVHDLGSRGGTFVNGERVHHRAPLHTEDILRFGENGPEVSFRLGRAHPGLQPLPPEPLPVGELVFTFGADAGRTFIVPADAPSRIGRRADLEVPLDPRGDLVVSGQHATIEYWNARFLITDSSRNGTFVNGEQVPNRAIIQDGDELTFGESGPRAMFRVMPARRVYPNLTTRRLTSQVVPPVAPPDEEDEEEFPPAPQVEAGEAEPAAEAPAEPQPEPPAPMRPGALLALRGAEPIPPAPPQHRAKIPMRLNLIRKHPAPLPKMRKRRSWKRKLFLTALFLGAVLLGFAAWNWWAGHRGPAAPPPAGDLIAAQVRNGEQLPAGQGHFSVLVPDRWSVRQKGPGIMLEPPDRPFANNLILEYYRAPGLTREAVRKLVSLDGAPVADLTGNAAAPGGGKQVSGYLAKSGGTARIAVLHEPELDVPAVALLEGQPQTIAEIPEPVLAKLLVEEVKLQQLAPRPAPTPVPTPAPALTPTPAQLAQVPGGTPPGETTGPVVTLPSDQGTSPSAGTPAPEAFPTPMPAGTVGGSLGVTVNIPEGYDGEEDETEKIVLLHGPQGFDVRIGRDPNRLDMDQIAADLEGSGWEMVTRPNVSDRFRAINIRKGETNAILALVYDPDGTTLVVWSEKQTEITGEERQRVSDVVGDLLMSAQE